MDVSIFIPCSDCSYLCLLELPQALPCLFPSKFSLFEAGGGPAQSRVHFEDCSGLGLVGFGHLQGWRCKPCPRDAPLSQGKISIDPLGISHVGPCALEKHQLHHCTAPQEPSPIPADSPLALCSSPAFLQGFLPAFGFIPGILGVWVTPEEEAAKGALYSWRNAFASC